MSLFTAALGLKSPWEVVDVAFDPDRGRIDLQVGFAPGTRFTCPHCGAEHQPVHDTQERAWRHLNFFQYQAVIHTKVPRVRCAACAKTTQVEVPWARPNSAFTLLMEALLVTLCRAMPVRQVAQLLGVSDMRIWRTLDHYVDQARAQEDFSAVTSIGIDETAARRGHDYISLFHDLDAAALLFACEGRKAEVVAQFADDLEAHGGCAENVRAVCIDMSASYLAGVDEHLPWAEITFDEFHVIQLVNNAVDEVRAPRGAKPPRAQAQPLHLAQGHARAGAAEQHLQFTDLKRLQSQDRTAPCGSRKALREIFASAPTARDAEPLLKRWYSWARRCRLEPIKRGRKDPQGPLGKASSTPLTPDSPTAASRPSIRSSRPPRPRPAATAPPGI